MKYGLLTLLLSLSFTLMASAQASGGQIVRKPRSSQRTTISAKPKHKIQDKENKEGFAELEKIKKQGEIQDLKIQDELLRTNDNNRKLEILKSASSSFESSNDYERAIKYYNQYLKLLSTCSINDLEYLAKLYSRFADYLSNYKLEEYRNEIVLKAVEVYRQLGEKFPVQRIYAAYQCATMKNKLDKTGEKGLAKPDYQKVVDLLANKTNRDNSENTMLKYSYHYLMSNAFIYGKNKALAKEYADKILAIDPEYAPALQIRVLK